MNVYIIVKELIIAYCYYYILKIRYSLTKKDEVVVIADNDNELNYLALAHLDEYLQKSYLKSVIIVTNKEFVNNNSSKLTNNVKKVIFVSKRFVNIMLSAYQIGLPVKYISLEKPLENRSKSIIGIGNGSGITKEDLVCYCCYGLFKYDNIESYNRYNENKNR